MLLEKTYKRLSLIGGLFASLALAGCATTLRNAVPIGLMNEARVVGFGAKPVRVWGDAPLPNTGQFIKVRERQILATRPHLFDRHTKHNISFLALSGGGADGAFGAGFLNGWTSTGSRPEFEVVTGVSTGALIAPFAFLGPDYDQQLREIYTLHSTKDIVTVNIVSGLLGGSALSSSEPMYGILSRYVNREFMAAVAREYRRGRRLLIGTTNLDAGRPVIWDMGLIATRNTDKALHLFRKVMLASTSIPGLFPPIYIEVEVEGKIRKEMHVDGGTTDNIILLPAKFDIRKAKSLNHARTTSRLYALVNTKINMPPKVVKANTFDIAERATSTLIKQQTTGDLLRLYLSVKNNNISFNLASVPAEFEHESAEAFDRKYMNALYDYGYKMARKGYHWKKTPPGL